MGPGGERVVQLPDRRALLEDIDDERRQATSSASSSCLPWLSAPTAAMNVPGATSPR